MKNETYKHFVITRFNIRVHFSCKLKQPENNPMERILDEDYLQERFNIFEKYTLKSMQQQTNQNFEWLILFHKKTPKYFKNKIKHLKQKYNFVDLYFDDDEVFNLESYLKMHYSNFKYFITTRIDNDDMFANDYIEQTQKYANNNFHECILSFEEGLQYDINKNESYILKRKDNHFLSLLGTIKNNILDYNHSKIFESGKEVIVLESTKPMWIEIIHNSNVHNTIKKDD